MVFIPETKKFNGKTYTRIGNLFTKAAADKEAAQLKTEGYSVRRQTVKEGSTTKYILWIKP
jgi:hypothetical protein